MWTPYYKHWKEAKNRQKGSFPLQRWVKWLACRMGSHERRDDINWNGFEYVSGCRWCGRFLKIDGLTGKPIKHR